MSLTRDDPGGCGACWQDAYARGAWQPPPGPNECGDPGWMLPLLILSRAYSTFLSTFGDDYMYRLQRPLPLAELHQSSGGGGGAAAPERGLVSLLKMAMWQVRKGCPLRLLVPPPRAAHASHACSCSRMRV